MSVSTTGTVPKGGALPPLGAKERQVDLTKALIVYRFGTFVAFAFMVLYSFEGKHTVEGIGLALVTGGVLCLTPEIDEALSSRALIDKLSLFGWRPRASQWVWGMVVIASGGGALIVLNVASVVSRLVGLVGVGLIEVAMIGIVPLWAGQMLTEMAKMTQEDEKLSARWADFETRKGPALLGALMFALGTLVQLVAATH
jgi:hypothetical protein